MRDRSTIYGDILRQCRQRVREEWWRCNRPRVEAERAHLALIVPLLRCVDERRHRHYLEVELGRFIRGLKPGATAEFEPLWAELKSLLPVVEPACKFARAVGPFRLYYRGSSSNYSSKPGGHQAQ